MFNWESEAVVVKQSGAGFISMIVSLIIIAVPGVLIAVLGNMDSNIIMLITIVVLGLLTLLVYRDNNKKVLSTIQ